MRRIRLSTLVMSLLLLLSALAPIMLAPRIAKIAKAQGGKSIPITIVERSGNDLANYTVKVELTADNFNDWDSILYDNGTDVYFTDSQGTPLYYWVEYFNKTEKKAIMWVKIPSISANEILTINMHYGADNPYKEYMNGTKTFIFFDDFDGNDLDPNKWSTEWLYGASYTVADSIITITSGGIRPYIHTLAVFTAPFAIRAKVKKINSDIELSWFITSPRGTTSNPGNTGYQLADRVWQSPEDIAIMKMSAQSWIELASVQYTVTSGWHIMEVFQKTDGIIGKIDEASVSTTDTEYQSGYIALSVRETSGDQVAYDWIFVRNLTEPEPYVAVNWTSGIKGSYYVPITIQERSGSNLTDYSVKIVLNSTNFHYWNHIAYWNGSDIYFTDEAGNPLYYWIESFDLGRKNATIWVKIPSIPANGTVTIHMHYGADNPYKDYMNRSAIFLVYDDFDDGILDTTTNFAYGWIDWSGWSSQTYIIHFNTTKNGIVKEENSNVYMEGAYLEAVFYACRHNVIGTHIECALKWTKTKARWRVALMNATDLASLDGQNFRLYANLIVSSASWSLSTTTFETFKIDVLNTTTVRVVLPNGTSIYVDVELGNGVAYVWFDTGNEDTNLYIDFIRIRRHICVYPEPSISYIGIEVGGAGILLRCFDKLLNKLNYEPLKILLVNKTTGEVVAELTGRYEFFIDTQLPQGTYLIIIKFMGVVLRALEVYFNATARVEVSSAVPALSLLADYRGLSRSFICNKTIVDVEDLNPKFPYSRSRVFISGARCFKLFINYQGDLPSAVSISANITNLQYYWNRTYLVIEGDLAPTITLCQNMTVVPNIVIAPHLWDWYFDGKDDYIEVPHSNSIAPATALSLEASFKIPPKAGEGVGIGIVSKAPFPDPDYDYMLYKGLEQKLGFYVKDSDGNVYLTSYPVRLDDNLWHHAVGTFDGRYLRLYVDEVLRDEVDTGGVNLRATTTPLYIGRGWGNYFKGYIAFVRLYSRALGQEEISTNLNQHIVNATGLALFLDPTFFNGTHYLDLSGYNNHGIPHGVKRVLAENKWMWLVKDLTSDGKVHFKYFPEGTVITLENATHTIQFTINSTDEAVDIPAGEYVVKAYIPLVEINVTDLYKIRLEVYDRLGNLMPSWIYAYINNTKYTGSTIEDYYYPEDYVIKVLRAINGFKFYRFFDGYNSTVRNITVSDSDVVYKVWYLVATNVSFTSKEVSPVPASLRDWFKSLFRLHAVDENITRVVFEGYLRDYYGNGVPNRPVYINITTSNTTVAVLLTTTDSSGYFRAGPIELFRGVEYNITVYFEGDEIYADTLKSTTFTAGVAPPPAPVVAGVPWYYWAVVIVVVATAVAIAVFTIRAVRKSLMDLTRPRKYVKLRS